MTEQTPATEAAWNSLRADLRVAIGDDDQAQAVVSWHRPKIAAAIEAEARADALREATDAVRDLRPTDHTVSHGYGLWGWNDAISRVLAILDPQP